MESLAVGRLRFLHRFAKGLLCRLSLGYVSSHLGRADHIAGGIFDRRYRDGDAEPSPVLSDTNRFEMTEAFAAPNAGEDLRFFFLVIRWNQSHDRAADHFVGGVSEDALRPQIPTGNDTVQVLSDDRIVRRIPKESWSFWLLSEKLIHQGSAPLKTAGARFYRTEGRSSGGTVSNSLRRMLLL